MWEIKTTDRFDEWFDALDDEDRANTVSVMLVLNQQGPQLRRPYADSLKGSVHSNMKELRIQSKGNPIRAFFAFDPNRAATLLCAGEKTGKEKRFYSEMILVADREFTEHLKNL